MRNLASDPLRNFKFQVSIIGSNLPAASVPSTISSLGFMSVDGFGIQNEVIPYREGGDNSTTRKMPGQSDFGPITFSRGAMSSTVGPNSNASAGTSEVYNWMQMVFNAMEGAGTGAPGDDFRTDITVDVLEHPVTSGPSAAGVNTTPAIKMRYVVYNAWPMGINWGGLDAGGSALLIESMQVAHEGFITIYGVNTPGVYLSGSQLAS